MTLARRGLALATALIASACASPPEVAQSDHPFEWLAGCWETDAGTREVWAIGADDLLFGYGTVPGETGTAFFEQLRIEQTQAGWRYMAYPRGVGPTAFESTRLSKASATFENPSHDYPQRLSYTLSGDKLEVDIALVSGEREQSWSMVGCRNRIAPNAGEAR